MEKWWTNDEKCLAGLQGDMSFADLETCYRGYTLCTLIWTRPSSQWHKFWHLKLLVPEESTSLTKANNDENDEISTWSGIMSSRLAKSITLLIPQVQCSHSTSRVYCQVNEEILLICTRFSRNLPALDKSWILRSDCRRGSGRFFGQARRTSKNHQKMRRGRVMQSIVSISWGFWHFSHPWYPLATMPMIHLHKDPLKIFTAFGTSRRLSQRQN